MKRLNDLQPFVDPSEPKPKYVPEPEWSGWEEKDGFIIGMLTGPYATVPLALTYKDVARCYNDTNLVALLGQLMQNGLDAYYFCSREGYKKQRYGS